MAEAQEQKLLRAFLEEGEELLEKLNGCLLELEKDTSNLELVHEIFRLTHSLKSESALIGFANLSELAHRLEDVFERLRSGTLILRKELLDVILSASDLIHEMVARISRGEGDGGLEYGSLVAQLERMAGIAPAAALAGERGDEAQSAGYPAEQSVLSVPLGPAAAAQAEEAVERGESLYQLTFRTEGEELMRYPRAYLVFSNLEQVANVLTTIPDLAESSESDELYSRVTIVFSSDLPEGELVKAFLVDQISQVELRRLELPAGPPAADRGQAEALGRAQEEAAASETAEAPLAGRIEHASVRVDTQKLDDLWQLVGELVSCKARFNLLATKSRPETSPDMERINDSLERIAAEMQQAVMETRMVPIAVLFNKFPRLVRDLSRKLGKSVDLEIHGENTEIDRSLVESLSDPLTHLIRNCLDHGIEAAEERLRLGKNETGKVSVSAQQRGGKIVVEVADDGKGLDLERIRMRAQAAPDATDEELVNFIFLPGFSTKESVTELSGRGVGLDVVATRIKEDLRGELQVRSEVGKGMTVTILLPLTLTILHSLVVRLGEHHFAIPIRDIDETVQVSPSALRLPRSGAPERLLHGEEDIPVVRLGALLEGETRAAAEAQSQGVIIRQKGQRACLLFDELVEEQDLVIKPIAELLNRRRLFSGVSVLGDGRFVFILDTARIVELPE